MPDTTYATFFLHVVGNKNKKRTALVFTVIFNSVSSE